MKKVLHMRWMLLSLSLLACGSPSGTLYVRISADPALASAFTTEDGWTLSFEHVVVAVKAAAGKTFTASKLIDFAKDSRVDLDTDPMAPVKTYDSLSLSLGRGATDENMGVPADVVVRMGQRSFWVEGTATHQSTTRRFQLGLQQAVTFDGCTPAVTVENRGTATAEFRVHAQRVFLDDAGKLRFDAWALADASPIDQLIETSEAQAARTSSLPSSQYGATQGSLFDVFTKRALGAVGLGDSGTCNGK